MHDVIDQLLRGLPDDQRPLLRQILVLAREGRVAKARGLLDAVVHEARTTAQQAVQRACKELEG